MRFEQIQQDLASHIRNPAVQPGPTGVESRRLKIYSDLFYNNIENFISNGFPMLRQLIDDDSWHEMVRDFMVNHECHTPYFLDISQEFLLYLQHTRQTQVGDQPFMLELAHYEWVELALDIADEDLAKLKVNTSGDLMTQLPVVSPLAWSLVYQYPVHKIGVEFQPKQPAEQPVYLVVYRNRDDEVGFLEANVVTARLLELLQSPGAATGQQVLERLAVEMQHPKPEQVLDSGRAIFDQLRSLDILLGTS